MTSLPLNFQHMVLTPEPLGSSSEDIIATHDVGLMYPDYNCSVASVEYDSRTATYTTTFDLTRKLEEQEL